MPQATPVVEGLFIDTANGPRLTGSRCAGCDMPYLPVSAQCHNPDCDAPDLQPAEFGPWGVIWSLARQDYPPPAPVKFDEPYQPYAMAVVDLDDGLRVLGRVATDDPESVDVGQRVELIIDTLAHDEDGKELSTWKFRVVEQGAGA
ncbi:MAG TPA: benzoylsuccinyl-CoA thiolase [Deltaproteobacteria bacterium]|nr:benzoylsuccinyl-CoA thiolase [Candidatus Binatota bacterium]HIL13618.1 benzoylsuccinyl-CoA thiolase [Deltaproteobacteria bacterium]